MHNTLRRPYIGFLGAILFLTACADPSSNEGAGQLIGGLVGAAVGVAVGDDLGVGDVFAGAVGAAAGTAVGGSIGRKLDEADRLKAEVATLSALQFEKDTTVRWRSDQNEEVFGTVSTRGDAAEKIECKTVKHVVNIRGKEYTERDRLCKTSDGSWQLS